MDRAASGSARKVGGRLVAARERRELDRAEAAHGAGVPLRFVTMLEEGSYPLIADPAYLVPYLRRYARFLGLSPDALVLTFHEENDAADRAAAVAMLSSVEEAREERRRFGKILAFAAVVTALLGAGFYARSLGITIDGVVSRLPIRGVTDAVASWTSGAWPRRAEQATAPAGDSGADVRVARGEPAMDDVPRAASQAVAPDVAPPEPSPAVAPAATEAPARPVPTAMPVIEPTVVPTPEPTTVPTPAEVALRVAPSPAPLRPTAVPARQHRLELTATARQVWVWVSVDGSRRRAIELRQGGKVEFKAVDEIVLSLDDAGGVIATFDGRRLAPLGPLGQSRRNIRFPSR